MENRIKSSATELHNVRSVVICAALIALYVVTNTLSLYVTQELKLTFAFLVLALLGYRFGAVTAAFAGIACDLVAYIVRPTGPLHLGFTLSTCLTCVVFALFLYRRELKLWRIIASRAVVNVFINILLNTYWLSNLYGKAYLVFLAERAFKNIVLLPVEVILLFAVLKAYDTIEKKVSRA